MAIVKTGSSEEKIIRTACNSHCGGQCVLQVHVKDGVITRMETDDGPEPQFRACLRGRSQRQRTYGPDRLKYPMKRVGERGEGKFERISWDEALDKIASELKRVKETYGPGAILFRGGSGDLGTLHQRKAFFRLLGMNGGFSQTWGFISHEGGRYASLAMYGTESTNNSRDNVLNSKLIILWSLNPSYTIMDTNTCWYLARARESGIPIIALDPRYTDTVATFANQWIPIRPNTDAAALVAMAYVMIKENLQDQKFLDTYTVGFDKFKDYVLGKEDGIPKTPEWAENITGVPAATLADLARKYATIKPAALLAGIAPGRTAYGEEYHRCTQTLAAMTGNIGIRGGDAAGRCYIGRGGLPFMKLGPGLKAMNPVDEKAPKRKYSLTGADVRDWGRINLSQIPDAILKGRKGGYPFDYKMMMIINSNYVTQTPDLNKTIRALKQLEFVAVGELFMTPTAKFADILLPTSSFFEKNDISISEGPTYGFQAKCIEPLYETKPQLEIANELARRMGLTDFNSQTEDELLRDIVKGSIIPDYDEFKRRATYTPPVGEGYIAFQKEIQDPAHNPFPTPSGKIEIYSQRLADMNDPKLPPIPKFIESWESHTDPLVKKYPLQLVTTHLRRRAHSQFDNVPWLIELYPQAMQISSADAAARGIKDGDLVRIFNDRGEMRIPARVTERIMPGVVDVPEGAWYNPDNNGVDFGGCTNVLTSDRVSPGGAVPHNTALVEVKKA
ncbi:MAG: molybdopterin-dependent oxidoreductase [Dehalococcoidales bacterium]|nr:molybdopterin-dependent oxidoreductase [Dehalococcoidales bacterium]